jgi:hypothetical protein
MDPGSVIPDLIRDRGDELLKQPGFVRPHSVIPGLTRNPCSSERDGGRVAGKGQNISGDLQPMDMDPGSSPGVTAEEGGNGPRARHPGLDPGPG